VSFVLRQACLTLNRSMPFPGSLSCDELANQAKAAGLFIPNARLQNGQVEWRQLGRCQIFLVRKTSTDWIHTGISFRGIGETYMTIEGNSDNNGSSNGYEVCQRTRSIKNKDFINLPL
jgi:hypothetical protein